MRSLLFVPGDSPRKLAKAAASGADALILDLEDSVALPNKAAARRNVLAFLREHAADPAVTRPRVYVRVNAFASGLSEGDLDAIVPGAPDGVVLPKARGGADVALLDSRLALREALHGLPDGSVAILPIATEEPAALFGLGSYAGSSPRLSGLTWGAEDLSSALGAIAARDAEGWTEPYRLARSLCLFGAAAAGVAAIDTVFTDLRAADGLRRECEIAARDGFAGKLAIHPDQVPVINACFAPSPAALAHASRVVAAFAAADGQGVVSLDGRMLDRPHLAAAERLLARGFA
jgi:citrate lyase subunit beta/citryl-CoA lyase